MVIFFDLVILFQKIYPKNNFKKQVRLYILKGLLMTCLTLIKNDNIRVIF